MVSVYFITFIQEANQSTLSYIIDTLIEYVFVLDILLNFLQSYQHPETQDDVTDLKEIAKNYVFRGWFFIDLVAVLPFEQFIQQGKIAKLLRLFRLPRLAKLFSMQKFKKLVKSLFKYS